MNKLETDKFEIVVVVGDTTYFTNFSKW